MTTMVQALRVAGHLATRLGDCGHPARTISTTNYDHDGSVYLGVQFGYRVVSARHIADTLALPVTHQSDHLDVVEAQSFTTVDVVFEGARVTIFGDYEPTEVVTP